MPPASACHRRSWSRQRFRRICRRGGNRPRSDRLDWRGGDPSRRSRAASAPAWSSIAATPLLVLDGVRKVYTRGHLVRRPTFTLEADLALDEPGIVGVVGPNGAGKTTLFEMMTGSNAPTSGRVLVAGTDIHRVKYRERDRLAIHYHQSYQVRRFRMRMLSVFLEPSPTTARWCICSTSRNSTFRMAISALCSISSASCEARAGWWSYACTPPPPGTWKSSPKSPSNSCSLLTVA